MFGVGEWGFKGRWDLFGGSRGIGIRGFEFFLGFLVILSFRSYFFFGFGVREIFSRRSC